MRIVNDIRKVLNLYAGIGGNRKLWKNVEVTAIESHEDIADIYQINYPKDTVLVEDALYILENHYDEYDFIWASPPCDEWTVLKEQWTRHKPKPYAKTFDLYKIIDFLQRYFKGDWVVENVKHKFLIPPSFNIGRHYFWSNKAIGSRDYENVANFSKAKKEELLDYLGLEYPYNVYDGSHDPLKVLRRAVHPGIGKIVMEGICV